MTRVNSTFLIFSLTQSTCNSHSNWRKFHVKSTINHECLDCSVRVELTRGKNNFHVTCDAHEKSERSVGTQRSRSPFSVHCFQYKSGQRNRSNIEDVPREVYCSILGSREHVASQKFPRSHSAISSAQSSRNIFPRLGVFRVFNTEKTYH